MWVFRTWPLPALGNRKGIAWQVFEVLKRYHKGNACWQRHIEEDCWPCTTNVYRWINGIECNINNNNIQDKMPVFFVTVTIRNNNDIRQYCSYLSRRLPIAYVFLCVSISLLRQKVFRVKRSPWSDFSWNCTISAFSVSVWQLVEYDLSK